jgi:acyl-CoA thioesterase FadM
VNLYLRLLWLLMRLPFVQRGGLFEPARLRFRVLPTDCDLNFHMNNGRYLTFMDLGRVHFLARTGLLRVLFARRWAPVLTAAEISFVRALPPLARFTLVSRLLTWDEKYFYLEQRFEHHGTLCAVALVKGLFLAGRNKVASSAVLDALGLDLHAPPMPQAVRHWNDLTSLKKEHVRAHG